MLHLQVLVCGSISYTYLLSRPYCNCFRSYLFTDIYFLGLDACYSSGYICFQHFHQTIWNHLYLLWVFIKDSSNIQSYWCIFKCNWYYNFIHSQSSHYCSYSVYLYYGLCSSYAGFSQNFRQDNDGYLYSLRSNSKQRFCNCQKDIRTWNVKRLLHVN